ncbi:P-loop containing nucleoside triphosphate hydrolase protein [Phlebopus sp. FC_14]|nr:P-loop containing nucleoside triphosphate hydrolase protein [Phlebopus sp. FC_14]
MAKRKAAIDSDDESSQASKRARTEDSDDDVQQVPSAIPKREANHKVNGKGKAKAHVDASDEEEEDDIRHTEEQNEEYEKKFEEDHGDVIRRKLEERRNTFGGIADHGIIEFVEMKHFMCHPHLTFTFGPQINFIIGHNGSGKSAVLSAITIALGGKAISTGRGTGLKSFIREGQQKAEVTISLKNQGEEAYRPKDWKIMTKDGVAISTKKDELAAICDHMNIQVDNPMNVLTQDAARQFLSASHPADKYKFFLRGTQLSQLSEESRLFPTFGLLLKRLLHASRKLPRRVNNATRQMSSRRSSHGLM